MRQSIYTLRRNFLPIAKAFKIEKDLTCEECGFEANNPEELHCHHIKPLRCGGTNDVKNLMVLCPKCHGYYETKSRKIYGAPVGEKQRKERERLCLIDGCENKRGKKYIICVNHLKLAEKGELFIDTPDY